MICPRKAEPNRDESNNSHKEHRTRAASCAVVSFEPVEQRRAGDEAKPIGADSQMPRKNEGGRYASRQQNQEQPFPLGGADYRSSEERRGGKECVRTCRYRWSL